MYDTILFDLDGTLTDPGEGVTNSVAYALEKRGIHVADHRELYCFIGPPLHVSFQTFYGFTAEEATHAIVDYREYYRDRGIYENVVYDGMEDVLRTLQAAGKTLAVATSKPEVFARRVLEHFHLNGYFDVIAGASMDTSRTAKSDIITYALAELTAKAGKAPDPKKTLMIGDRSHDIHGAANNGLDSMGILYGYGDRAEMEEAQATYIAETVADILPIALS